MCYRPWRQRVHKKHAKKFIYISASRRIMCIRMMCIALSRMWRYSICKGMSLDAPASIADLQDDIPAACPSDCQPRAVRYKRSSCEYKWRRIKTNKPINQSTRRAMSISAKRCIYARLRLRNTRWLVLRRVQIANVFLVCLSQTVAIFF